MTKIENRVWYFDLLRIFACMSVIMTHLTAGNIDHYLPTSFSFRVSLVYSCLSRMGVILFLMISGAIFLEERFLIGYKKLFQKYMLHILIAYLFWLCLYNAVGFLENYPITIANIKLYIMDVVYGKGNYHLWYLPMLLSIYILIPFLKKIVDRDSKLTIYFLLLFFLIQILMPSFMSLDFVRKGAMTSLSERIPFTFVNSFVGYFVLGHYLHTTEFSKKKRYLLYGVGVISLCVCILYDGYHSILAGKAVFIMNDVFHITIFFISIATFLLFRYGTKSWKKPQWITRIARYTFGVYLVHVLVLNIVMDYIIGPDFMNQIVSLPCIALITFALSIVIVKCISLIPVANKYII